MRTLAVLLLWVLPLHGAPLPPRQIEKSAAAAADTNDDPPLSDLSRFPSRLEVLRNLEWSWEHQKWLKAQRDLDCVDPDWWGRWLIDAEKANEPWMLLWSIEAFRPELAVEGELRLRGWLADLKDQIGPFHYANGTLPPIAPPFWRFRHVP